MKKVIILTLTLLLTANFSFAQTDEPSKKETFDFILLMLNKSNNAKINNYNSDKYSIDLRVDNLNVEYSFFYFQFELKDLVEIEELKGNEFILNFRKNIRGTVTVQAYPTKSKDDSTAVLETWSGTYRIQYSDFLTYTKTIKALNHWIKLNKVNESLFDD